VCEIFERAVRAAEAVAFDAFQALSSCHPERRRGTAPITKIEDNRPVRERSRANATIGADRSASLAIGRWLLAGIVAVPRLRSE